MRRPHASCHSFALSFLLTGCLLACEGTVSDGDPGAGRGDDDDGAIGADAAGGGGGGGGDGNGGGEDGQDGGPDTPAGDDMLRGYWVWEQRVQGDEVQTGPIDDGQQKLAFGTGNDKCHYIWNETTGSDFHTECTYTVEGDMVIFNATADPDGTAAGYSCAHPDWTAWNDRPATQWGRYKLVGDRLWIGVNTYWGFGGGVEGVPSNGSLKRFPFWESRTQAETSESWIVFMPVTREQWYGQYAISTTCQGSPEVCAQWPGCGAGDKGYVD